MTKRKSLTKKSVKTGAESSGCRVIISSKIGARRRELINPGPSQEAIKKIERFEAASLRAEQRLGLTRLA